ncbi:hypothetical protein MTO96_033541 [Rhipicephalus appendiculatus]
MCEKLSPPTSSFTLLDSRSKSDQRLPVRAARWPATLQRQGVGQRSSHRASKQAPSVPNNDYTAARRKRASPK